LEDPGALVYKNSETTEINGVIYAIDETQNQTPVSSIDTTKLGKYIIKYTDEDAGEAIRLVNVVDTTSPVIGATETTITYLRESRIFDYEAAITVTDNYDTSVTVQYTKTVNDNEPGTYEVVYIATDSSGNNDTVTITVIVTDFPAYVYYYNSDDNKQELEDNQVFTTYQAIYFDKGTATIRKDGGEYEAYNNDTLQDGTYTIKVTSEDGQTTIKNFIIDTKGPVITGVQHLGRYNEIKTIVFEDVNDVATATITKFGTTEQIDLKEYFTNNNTNSYTIQEAGTYTIYATDIHGIITEIKFRISL